MLIKSATIFREDYNNHEYRLQLILSDVPDYKTFRYGKKTVEGLNGRLNYLYYAHHECGLVSFFSWRGIPDRGFGGGSFRITLLDGTPEVLVGPWSSNAAAMCRHGFEPCIEALYSEEEGYSNLAGHVTVAKAKEILKQFDLPYCVHKQIYGKNNQQEDGYGFFPVGTEVGSKYAWSHYVGEKA